jgi:hypothetical protein
MDKLVCINGFTMVCSYFGEVEVPEFFYMNQGNLVKIVSSFSPTHVSKEFDGFVWALTHGKIIQLRILYDTSPEVMLAEFVSVEQWLTTDRMFVLSLIVKIKGYINKDVTQDKIQNIFPKRFRFMEES